MDTARESGPSRPTPVGDFDGVSRVEAMRALLNPEPKPTLFQRLAMKLRLVEGQV